MKPIRLAVLVVLLAAVAPRPASAFGWPVVDVAQLIKHAAEYATHGLQLAEQTSIYHYYRRFARRLWIFRDANRYHLEDVPRVRTWRQLNPLAESLSFMTALNAGVSDPAAILGDSGPDPEIAIPPALAASQAALAARTSLLLDGIDQTGRWRAQRRTQRVLLNTLEGDVLSGAGSTTARLDVIAAGRLLGARQHEDRIDLLGAAAEQLIVEEIARREADALAVQMRQETIARPLPDRSRLSADLLSGWKQP